jgi:hypothetical protein
LGNSFGHSIRYSTRWRAGYGSNPALSFVRVVVFSSDLGPAPGLAVAPEMADFHAIARLRLRVFGNSKTLQGLNRTSSMSAMKRRLSRTQRRCRQGQSCHPTMKLAVSTLTFRTETILPRSPAMLVDPCRNSGFGDRKHSVAEPPRLNGNRVARSSVPAGW